MLLLLILAACHSAIEKQVQGIWIIEEAYYQDRDIKDGLMTNVLLIEPNGICETPLVSSADWGNNRAHWELEENDGRYFLNITTDDIRWNRKYAISFSNRKQGSAMIPELTLESDSLLLKCSK